MPVEKCLLADEMICERKASLEKELEEKAAGGEKQKFVKATIRSSASGEVMTILESKTGFVQSDWRVIHDEIKTDMSVLKTEVSPLSFYQVNPTQCSKLYSKVQDYADLKGGEKILDLYCGAGSIGLSMANKAARVIGVESVKPAIIDANRNAVINGIVNAEFICGKAEEAVPTKLQGVKADVVILDPPRSGCKESLLDTVASIGAEKIIYVSCNPSTLARDLKILCSKGYEFVEATPVDMFANTVHCEVICLMSKG